MTSQVFNAAGPISGNGDDGSPLRIDSDSTPTGGAFMSFHRPGIYATRFGLNENNEFALGGWSEGVGRQYRFWTEKNLDPNNVNNAQVVSGFSGSPVYIKEIVGNRRHDIRDYTTGGTVDLTGINDESARLQKALNASSTNPSIGTGVPLEVPPGLIALGSAVSTWHGVQLQGAGKDQIHHGRKNRGTTFLIGHSGSGFDSRTPGPTEWAGDSNYRQFFRAHLRDFSTMRNQPDPELPGAYTPDLSLGYDFDLNGCTTLSRVHLTNPTRGIRIYDGGQTHLFDISGSPLFVGIDVDRCTETCYFDKIEFWPFWFRDLANESRLRVMVWTLNNMTAFTIGRMDATFWSNIFSIWCQNSLVLRPTSSVEPSLQGGMTGVISSMNMDGCVYGLVALSDDANITFSNLGVTAWDAINQRSLISTYGQSEADRIWAAIGQQSSSSASSHLLRIEGNGNKFRFDSISSAWSRFAVLGVNGKQNNVTVNSIEGRFWNQYFSPDNQVQYSGEYNGPYGIAHNNDPSNYVSVDNAYAPNESPKGPLLSGSIWTPQKSLIPQTENSQSTNRQQTVVSDGRSHTFLI